MPGHDSTESWMTEKRCADEGPGTQRQRVSRLRRHGRLRRRCAARPRPPGGSRGRGL